MLRWLLPRGEERRLLGRFYFSDFVGEATNILLPFEFIFLVLVLESPEWAIVPLLVEGIAVFLLEIPTGIVADRFGRKRSVILGDLLSAFAWALVPLAITFSGIAQLVAVCACFALEGLGQALVSGADEAWVVDRLDAAKREDLVDCYYGRQKSLASLGGVISGGLALTLLYCSETSLAVLSLLWFVAAAGHALSALLLLPIPEAPMGEDEELRGLGFWQRGLTGFRAIWRIGPLLAFFAVMAIVSLATSITGDAFELSLLTRGFDVRHFASISIYDALLGIVTPLLAVALGRKLGRRAAMILLLVLAAALSCVFFCSPGIVVVVALLLLFNALDDLWDPIADAHLQSLIPSRVRATVGSVANQVGELAGIVGLAFFGLLLGGYAEQLRDSVPDLIETFAGEAVRVVEVPVAALGMPVTDLALVLFSAVGLLAAGVLGVRHWHVTARGDGGEAPAKSTPGDAAAQTDVSTAPSPERQRLIQVKESLDERLERYNPGEQLSWWVAADAVRLPARTLGELRAAGEALPHFFAVANDLFYEEPWIRKRLEKGFSPNYRLLNRAQRTALPYLIRPDVVCDEDWTPRLVELEITVGCRADTSVMAEEYGLAKSKGLVRAYAEFLRRKGWGDCTLALVTAPHPFFLDLPDDARAFGALLRREGVDVVVLTDENLPFLRFDGEQLWLESWDGHPTRPIHLMDRFIDIYEIAELQHPGMGALLDALVAGKVIDINTSKQFLDEKDWMALFWEPRLRPTWEARLGAEHDAVLRRLIPGTWIIRPDTRVHTRTGEEVPIQEIGDLLPEHRRFVIKESGTSTTASGAQSFYVLHQMEREEIDERIQAILASEVEYIVQELVESPKVSFTALDPEDDRMVTQHDARFKLSVFYVDGLMSDIRYVASNEKYAVNDQNCMVGVVRY